MEIALLSALLVLGTPQAQQGQAILDRSFQRLKSTQSLTLEMVMTGSGRSSTAKLSMLRGGYLRVETDGFEQVATPETTWILVAAQKQYMKQPTKDKRLLLSAAPGFEAVLAPGSKLIAKGGAAASHLGKQSTTRVQFESPDSGMPGAATQYLHIDPKTSLPAGVSVEMNGQKFAMEYRNIRLDAALTPKRFAWAPPAGWKEMSSGAPQDGLLKIGSKAPDFAVLTPSGKKLSLAQVMKGKKATLVNFWFYG